MNKLWIATLAAASLAAAAAHARPLTNAQARAAPEPMSENVFGRTMDDPWRWMEAPDRAAQVEAFVRASSAHSIAELATLPGRNHLRDRIAAALQAGVRYTDVQQAGGLLFYRRIDPAAQLAKLIVRTADGVERILYDPEAGGTLGAAINNYSVSPDGRTVALHTASGGAEVGAIRFIDVANGTTLADRLEPIWGEFEVGWLDGRTMTFTRLAAADGADPMQNMRMFVHRLGGDDSGPILGRDVAGSPAFAPQEFPLAEVLASSDWVLGYGAGARADARLFVARRADVAAGRPGWRVISEYSDRISGTAALGDRLFLISTHDAPNGAVLSLDLAARAILRDAAVAMQASDAVLTGMAAAPEGVYVSAQTDGLARLFFIAGGSGPPVELQLPMRGAMAGLSPAARDGGVTFAMEDWFTAPRWFRATATAIAPLGLNSASYGGIAGARQLREAAVSADGTRVPLAILLPPGAPSSPLPMLLEGYGSYGVNSAEPYYAQDAFGLLEAGGGMAYCGTRGGGERGRAWHEGGRSANKPNAHADMIACAERLVQLGLTRPDRLTAIGTSAGGLLVPPAAISRPDLFGALIANVAILNPTRLAVAENGANQFGEMGDPIAEEGFRALTLADSYLMLGSVRDIPNTLVTIGLNDRRVAPWMSAKFAARALDRFGAQRLVLIRTDPEAGHGIGSARRQLIEQYADMFAFVLNQAAAEGFTAP